MKYYLGVDAGGTKTHCLVGDGAGGVLGFGKGGAGNYEVHGVDAARVEIERAVQGALDEAGLSLSDIAGVGLGIAGADLPEDYVMLEEAIFSPLFGDIPTVFRNDSMGCLRGGTRKPVGIVIACGTGCVCAGVNGAGEETRVGGISEDFGDKVSGTELGIEGLKMVWRYRDGIIGETALVDLFLERSGCPDVDALFYKFYREEMGYSDLEPMAQLVFEAAAMGDVVACDILEDGGRYLGMMVNAVARKLNMTGERFEVVMAGSVFKGKSPVMKDSMRLVIHDVCPYAELVMPVYEPVVGTLLLGMEQELEVDDGIYSALTTALEAAEAKYGVSFKTVD